MFPAVSVTESLQQSISVEGGVGGGGGSGYFPYPTGFSFSCDFFFFIQNKWRGGGGADPPRSATGNRMEAMVVIMGVIFFVNKTTMILCKRVSKRKLAIG